MFLKKIFVEYVKTIAEHVKTIAENVLQESTRRYQSELQMVIMQMVYENPKVKEIKQIKGA